MTVNYNNDVASVQFPGLLKLLLRWKGSLVKTLLLRLLLCIAVYYALTLLYFYGLNKRQQETFVWVVNYCSRHCTKIPVTFVLGFYVEAIFEIWWDKFTNIPWPSRFAMLVTSHVRGHDIQTRMMRRTLVRYTTLGFVLTMRSICPPVRFRFPTPNHLVDAGFLLPHEKEILDKIPARTNKFFVPFIWASVLVQTGRGNGCITEYGMKALCYEINSFREHCFHMFNFDWVAMPLAYTQLAMYTVYIYTFGMIIGQIFVDSQLAFFFPFFAFLQFMFYHGWLKVGEMLMNPLGSDDDDFDINPMIDAFLTISYAIVDDMHDFHPPMTRDLFWDTLNIELPHTLASAKHIKKEMTAMDFATLTTRIINRNRRRSSAQVTLTEEPLLSADILRNEKEDMSHQLFHMFMHDKEKDEDEDSQLTNEERDYTMEPDRLHAETERLSAQEAARDSKRVKWNPSRLSQQSRSSEREVGKGGEGKDEKGSGRFSRLKIENLSIRKGPSTGKLKSEENAEEAVNEKSKVSEEKEKAEEKQKNEKKLQDRIFKKLEKMRKGGKS